MHWAVGLMGYQANDRDTSISSLHELFDTVNAQNILGFIGDIGLYRLL